MVRFVQRDICLIKKKVRNNQNAYMLYAIHALSYLHMQAGIVDAILARRVGGWFVLGVGCPRFIDI